MNAIERNAFHLGWQDAARRLPRPKAVLCVSAHWETRGLFVTASARPETIHDFYGFPRALFDVRYPAPGDPDLARRVAALLGEKRVRLDPARGLDHGAWSVLAAMYPEADVPVVQLSLDTGEPGEFHLAAAEKLAPLRREGVLILASGNIVHNLGLFSFHDPKPLDWALRFDAEVRQRLTRGDVKSLLEPHALGPDAKLAVPTLEHYLPLLYAAALRGPDEPLEFFNSRVWGSLSMTSVIVGEIGGGRRPEGRREKAV